MRLYLLPVPLSRESSYWMYDYWREIAQQIEHFFVERISRVRGLLSRVGVAPTARFYEYDARLHDWSSEAYEAVFTHRYPAGLLSEGGLPGVADPGMTLVRRAHAEGYEVIPLAGPSSITLALAASGLSGQAFTFWGYPPISKPERRRFLQKVFSQAHHMTQIIMESPARNDNLLQEIVQSAPPTLYLCVAHHLTAPTGFIRTQPVALWKPTPLPKAPTLFLLGA
ncbi:MAG: SAM-dependent methyltransferase [Bacteroidia bacterium]|nr:SAM-dependent methyltransferase [Bacteroidia bacterium]MCX7652491.1 SAM-dependent methyltransferase [Bacteroidia bacterium]MDW8416686.1 SAM-dependent methyltransferase [Bacteroidia bacterium]